MACPFRLKSSDVVYVEVYSLARGDAEQSGIEMSFSSFVRVFNFSAAFATWSETLNLFTFQPRTGLRHFCTVSGVVKRFFQLLAAGLTDS